MNKSTTVQLITTTYERDELGQPIPVETARTVFCNLGSITRAEWFEAGRNGMKPQYKLTMFRYDYQGEPVAVLAGKRYGIYRTYLGRGDTIELYLEEKAGV